MFPRHTLAIVLALVVVVPGVRVAGQSRSASYIVVFDQVTPFASFAAGHPDERTLANPAAWQYLDEQVLGTVQTLELQFAFTAEHVYAATIAGFAATLTAEQVEQLQRLPFVTSIERDSLLSNGAPFLPEPPGQAAPGNLYIIDAGLDGLALQRQNVVRHANVSGTAAACASEDTLRLLDRWPAARVTTVTVGGCAPTRTRISDLIKGLDLVTATAVEPAVVRIRGMESPGAALSAAIIRAADRGFEEIRAAAEPTSPATRDDQRTIQAPLAAAIASTASSAAIYNLKVVTDASPDLSDLDSLIHSTTSRWSSDREKVWALFYWGHILRRQTPPMKLHGVEVTDPIRNLMDYGFAMCSTASGMNQTLFEALGLRHQYWDICNHTVSQVEYDDKFHMIDTSFSNLVTTDDGVTLASLQEVAASSARLLKERSLYSTSANGFLTGSDGPRNLKDFVNPTNGDTVTGLERAFCETGLKYRDYYYNWDSGHRYVLNLRENESYTRYYRRLGTTSDYWVTDIDSDNKFGVRGNGIWTFSPDLSAGGYQSAAYRVANVAASASGGLMPSTSSGTGELVYKVQAGNAITSQKVHAVFARTDSRATAVLSISLNHGRTWTEVASLGTTTGAAVPLDVSLRNQVSAAYETLLRVRMNSGGAPPDAITLTDFDVTTTTQVNAKALPGLNIGKNEIFVGAGDQTDTMVLWPDLRSGFWQADVHESSNIAARTPTGYTAVVYPAALLQDAHLTYRMDAPGDITRLVYGGRLHNYRAGSYIDFLHSFDNGANWIRSYRHTDTARPWDVVHYETVTGIPAGVRTVLFRFLIHNTETASSRAAGLYSVRMEADHRPPVANSRPVDVTLRWKEVRSDRSTLDRSHRQRVAQFPFTYVVNVGGSDHPVMESIKVNLEDPGDSTPYGYSGGDPGGSKYIHTRRTDGTNYAKGRPYSVSRAPSGFQGSPGAGNTTILTDGVVGSPVTGGSSYFWGQCWTGDVDLQIDLGQPQNVGAFRAHLFGYPFHDALKGQVGDEVEVFTSADGASFQSQGLLKTSLWKKDIPINHMLQDDERATGWNFERALAARVPGVRYVRFRLNQVRSNPCISELQVLDQVTYSNFDIRVALPDGGAPPDDTTPPVVAITAPTAGATVSGSIALAATATDNRGVARVDFIVDGTVVASDPTSPYSVSWDSSSVGNGAHTVSARAEDTSGNTATSSAVNVTVANADTSLPPPWQQADIGAVGVTGSASHSNGTFVVRGAGADVWGTADAFHFAYQQWDGDGLFTADVSAANGIAAWTKVGIMIRQSLHPGAAHHFLLASTGRGLAYQRRPVADGASLHTALGGGTTARFAIRRTGSTLQFYMNDNLQPFATASFQEGPVLVGLAVSSHDPSRLASGVFDDVSLQTSADAPPFVEVTGPPAGVQVDLGDPVFIEWTADDDVGIARYDAFAGSAGGATVAIAECTNLPPTAASCAWQSAGPASDRAFVVVRATDTSGQQAEDRSGEFVIRDPGSGTLPAGWVNADVGDVGLAGSASYADGRFTVRGAGADIWGTADALHFAYQELPGDGAIEATVVVTDGAAAWTKVGIMIRQSLNPGSAQHMLLASAARGLAYQRRPTTGGTSLHTPLGAGSSARFRIVRHGTTLTLYMSGVASPVATAAFPAGAAYVGLAVSSHDRAALATGTFSDVSVVQESSALPDGWSNRDIGGVAAAGTAAYDAGTETFTVAGSGADVWGAADELHFASRLWADRSVPFELTARATSVEPVNRWTKAGIMVREHTGPGAAHASLFVTPTTEKGTAFQRRPVEGGASVHTSGPATTAPLWLRLVVSDTVVEAYVRTAVSDPWTFVGSDVLTATRETLEIGLAVSSHVDGTLAMATFDNVAVTPR